MNLSKHEYVALELMKARDISVKEAHNLASEFLQQESPDTNKDECPSNTDLNQSSVSSVNALQPREGQRWVNLVSSHVLTIDTANTICWGKSSDGFRRCINFPNDLSRWQLLYENEIPKAAIERAMRERKKMAASTEMNIPLDDIFTIRTASALRSNNIGTLADLLSINTKTLEAMQGIGVKSLRDVRNYLTDNNLALGMLATY